MKKRLNIVNAVLLLFLLFLPAGCSRESVDWQAYSPEVFEAAQKSGEPIILDFYADWCGPCLKMKYETFADAQVVQALQGFQRIRIDSTYNKPEILKIQNQFQIMGLPTMVFLKKGGEEVGRLRGFSSKERLLLFLGMNHARIFDGSEAVPKPEPPPS